MKVLVTGGGGFLGGAIVNQLLARGDQVRVFARGDYPHLVEKGVELVRGDLEDEAQVLAAVQGVDAVIHTAAKVDMWGKYEDFYRTNVYGTQNIIEACLAEGVRKLVYTSSPSVIHNGLDMEGVDESVPYPDDFEAHYPKTKAMAEQLVISANGQNLATVSLRPHLIWGPGDTHLIPSVLEKARAGRLRFIGFEDKIVDTVYVDNAAAAHLNALDRVDPGAACAGKAYFITQDEPMTIRDVVNRFLSAADIAPVDKRISEKAAYRLATVAETVYRILPLKGEPPMTRFVANQLATAHWFDISAAKADLAYTPTVSFDEGVKKLRESLR